VSTCQVDTFGGFAKNAKKKGGTCEGPARDCIQSPLDAVSGEVGDESVEHLLHGVKVPAVLHSTIDERLCLAVGIVVTVRSVVGEENVATSALYHRERIS